MMMVMATMLMVVVKLDPSGGACAVACFNSLATDDWGRSVGDPIFISHFVSHSLHFVFNFLFVCCLFCLRLCLFRVS